MTHKELKHLRRSDLMEMLLELSKENLRLQEELSEANRKLEARELDIAEAGSLAEAALRLNRIFEDAQAACDQYRHNVTLRCDRLEAETRRKCGEMEAEVRRRCGEAKPKTEKKPRKRRRK